jgi:hypothetical protein
MAARAEGFGSGAGSAFLLQVRVRGPVFTQLFRQEKLHAANPGQNTSGGEMR